MPKTIVIKVNAIGQLTLADIDPTRPAASQYVEARTVYAATKIAPLKFEVEVPTGEATLHAAMSDWPTQHCVEYLTSDFGSTGVRQAASLGLPVKAPVAVAEPIRTMKVSLTSYGKLTLSSFGSTKIIDLQALSTPGQPAGYYLALKCYRFFSDRKNCRIALVGIF